MTISLPKRDGLELYDIDVTPEMIEAGVCALTAYGPEGDSAESVAFNVFAEILRARSKRILKELKTHSMRRVGGEAVEYRCLLIEAKEE